MFKNNYNILINYSENLDDLDSEYHELTLSPASPYDEFQSVRVADDEEEISDTDYDAATVQPQSSSNSVVDKNSDDRIYNAPPLQYTWISQKKKKFIIFYY